MKKESPRYEYRSGSRYDRSLYDSDLARIRSQRRRNYRRKHSPVRRVLRWIVRIFLIMIAVAVIAAAFFIRSVISEAPELNISAVSPSESASYILDAEGSRLRKLTAPESNRDLVTLDRVPADLQHAFIAIEDKRFYSHNGIDIQGIIRAAVKGILKGSFTEGASTITQQLLKNSVFTDWTEETTFEQRLKRKIQEQYLAIQLEKILSKDNILEDYLNTINLGAGCYGVQAAAYTYFGKDVSELTLSEDAVIAGITQNPSRYNPKTNPSGNAVRRMAVLHAMLDQKYITQDEYNEAIADDVYARIQSNTASAAEDTSVYSYYDDALIEQVLEDLISQQGYTYKQAYKAVYSGGLRIFSAQDSAIQAICDEEFENASNFPASTAYGLDYALSIQSKEGEIHHYGTNNLQIWVQSTSDPDFDLLFDSAQEARDCAASYKESLLQEGDTVLGERITVTPQPQASCVIIDQSTGYVRALVGGRGSKDASLTLNRAAYTTRQPGSTFKILTAYAPALENAGMTLATTFGNRQFTYSDGVTQVHNSEEDDYSDISTMRRAIVRSENIPAVECITAITPRTGYNYACAFGITTLVDSATDSSGHTFSDIIQPLALGGITNGVTNLELCGAYAAIADQGTYHRPTFYLQVQDSNGNVILDNLSPSGRTVISPQTASLLTDAMMDVISDENGTAYGDIDLGNMPVAGKTGTTSDYRDIWFTGYTPYYTCSVWGGYDNNKVLPTDDPLGKSYSKVLWNSIMTRIHESLPATPFVYADDLTTCVICKESGLLPGAGCETITEYFKEGTAPTQICDGTHAVADVYGSAARSTAAEAAGTDSASSGGAADTAADTARDSVTSGDPAGAADAGADSGSTADSAAGAGADSDAAGISSDGGLTPGDPNAITIYSSDEASLVTDSSGSFASQSGSDAPGTGSAAGQSAEGSTAGSGTTGGTGAGDQAADSSAGSVPDIVIYSQDSYSSQ